jgi:hypothetical protein
MRRVWVAHDEALDRRAHHRLAQPLPAQRGNEPEICGSRRLPLDPWIAFGMLPARRLYRRAKLPPGPDAPPAYQTAYLIQPGDQLDVKFVKNPELNEQPVVQPDGRISMLYAHNLEAGGRSTQDMWSMMDEFKRPH